MVLTPFNTYRFDWCTNFKPSFQTKMFEAGFRRLFQRLELIAGLETGVEHTADDGGQDQVEHWEFVSAS